jgi:hypothetical protein
MNQLMNELMMEVFVEQSLALPGFAKYRKIGSLIIPFATPPALRA